MRRAHLASKTGRCAAQKVCWNGYVRIIGVGCFAREKGPLDKLFQFTKMCNGPKLTVAFSGITVSVSFSVPIWPFPQLDQIKSKAYPSFPSASYSWYFSLPYQTSHSSNEKLFLRQKVEARRWSWHVLLVRQVSPADCGESQNYVHWELFATRCCLYSNWNHLYSSISKDNMFLQASCQVLVGPSAYLRETITLSLLYDINSDSIYLTYNNSLLLLMFPFLSSDVLDIIMI
jgi:hypothetical protein